MRSIALEALDYHIGAIGLEGNTVIAVVDDRILDHDRVGTICVPSVGVLGGICVCALHCRLVS